MKRRNQPPVHPFAPVLLALIAFAILGLLYWAFGIDKDAFIYLVAMLGVFAIPVVIVFGITGVVLGIRRLIGGPK
jgi:ABC-type proline/glycine betaine transport system permease subunit